MCSCLCPCALLAFLSIYILKHSYTVYTISAPRNLFHWNTDQMMSAKSVRVQGLRPRCSMSLWAHMRMWFCSVLDTSSYPTKRVSCLPDIADLIRSCLFHNFSLILFVFVLNVLRLYQINFIVHLSGMFIVVCQAQSALRSFAWLLSASVINKLAHILRRVEQRAASYSWWNHKHRLEWLW